MAITSFSGKYEFLSNFYYSPVTYEGITYPTVEHAFQAAKTFDVTERRRISEMKTPGMAKRAGRRVLLREDWEAVKFDIMKTLVTQKFEDEKLKQLLLDTGDEELVEGNTWHDTCWGVCNGVGQNNLGKILMSVRKHYKA